MKTELAPEIINKLWAIASRIPFESKYLIQTEWQKPINLEKEFGKKFQSYILELGSGWGEVGISLAKENPDTGFILMEKNPGRVLTTVKRLENETITNIRVICFNFNWFLKELFNESQFDKVILNFPDPWPKKKHHDNRTLDEDFPDKLYHLLKPGGIFHFATDHGGYGRQAIRIFRKESRFIPIASEYSFSREDFPLSVFETEKRAEKKRIYYLTLRR